MTLAFAKKVTGTWPYDRILTLYKDLDGKANDFMTEFAKIKEEDEGDAGSTISILIIIISILILIIITIIIKEYCSRLCQSCHVY